jgi:hypothetical protein
VFVGTVIFLEDIRAYSVRSGSFAFFFSAVMVRWGDAFW